MIFRGPAPLDPGQPEEGRPRTGRSPPCCFNTEKIVSDGSRKSHKTTEKETYGKGSFKECGLMPIWGQGLFTEQCVLGRGCEVSVLGQAPYLCRP